MCTLKLSSCCWYHKGTNFQANHNIKGVSCIRLRLLLIPQRYEFSSKSQQAYFDKYAPTSCCWYHKGTNFQANHNLRIKTIVIISLLLIPQRYEFSSKSQHCFEYNDTCHVVADTTKVRIFKQITTISWTCTSESRLLLIPQRYEFSSKSQPGFLSQLGANGCCWYHKGTNFQANHNNSLVHLVAHYVVADTTKVRIFKQITTNIIRLRAYLLLLLIPQRYEFSSKSQLTARVTTQYYVVADTTKVRIFKQITTVSYWTTSVSVLLLIPQRYEFSSKSQQPLNFIVDD